MQRSYYLNYLMVIVCTLNGTALSHPQTEPCTHPTVTLRNSLDEIKKAQRNFYLACHPDKRLSVTMAQAEKEFIVGNNAYRMLRKAKLKEMAQPKQSCDNSDEKLKQELDNNPIIKEIVERIKKREAELEEFSKEFDARRYNPEKALCDAIKKGDLPKVRSLMKAGVSANAQDQYGKPALIIAVQAHYVPIVELLLKHGANINEKYLHETALAIAVAKNDLLITQILLENGANANDNYLHETLLATAVMGNRFELTALLLKHGADINTAMIYGQTALIYALKNDYDDIAELLIAHNADFS